jgi:hypothetical protein
MNIDSQNENNIYTNFRIHMFTFQRATFAPFSYVGRK